MKKIYISFSLLLIAQLTFAQGIVFFKGSWQEVLQKAKSENKMIFVDFYTTWCAPCKFMSGTVFTQSEVASYYNNTFINYQVNAEKEELEFVKHAQISGYPTLAFFKPDGTEFFRKMGGIDAGNFVALGKQVADFEKNKSAYEKNNKDVAALGPYVQILMQTDPDKASLIAKKYLAVIKTDEMRVMDNWALIFSFEQDPDSRFFEYSLEHFKFFMDSMPGYQEYFTATSGLLLQRAVEKNDEKLLDEYKRVAASAIEQMGMEQPAGFNDEVEAYFYSETNQKEKYFAAMDHWILTYVSDVEVISNNTIEVMDKYGAEAFEHARKWAEKAINLQQSSFTYLTMAFVYRDSGKKQEALKYAEKAKALAGPEDDLQYIDQFISEIKAMKD